MNPFRWLKDYFDLSRSERNGTLLLMALVILLIGGRYCIPLLVHRAPMDFSEIAQWDHDLRRQLAEIKTADADSQPVIPELDKESASLLHPFSFDPNTIDEAGLTKLGLASRIIGHILKYRSKGGKFYKAADFSRIYGLSEEDFAQLEPFIHIAGQEKYAEKSGFKTFEPKKKAEPVIVELNSADSLTLLNVKGIGPVFASRILRFRNSLGGFYSMEQLREVFGIDSDKYTALLPQLRLDAAGVHTININEATADELAKHPYIRWKLANVIVQYRKQHGPYKTVDDLSHILIMKKEDLIRLSPYLRTD